MSNFTRLLLFAAVWLMLLLAACAPAPTQTSEAPTNGETSEVSPTPSAALRASAAPTATATEIPASPSPAPAELSATLGLSPEFSAKLKNEGFDSAVTQEADGSWSATKVISGFNPDGTPIFENNVKVASFEDAPVHNAQYPNGILKAVDSQGKAIYWSEIEKSWMQPMEMKTDNTKNPNYIENPNSVSWGKVNRAIEAVLLNPDLNKPFPDEAVKNFEGWSINFEYDEATKSSHAYLRPRNNQSIRWALDGNGKLVFFTTTTPDGVVHESILVQLLNPKDPKNPKADETIFVLASAGEWWNEPIRSNFVADYVTNPGYPPFWEELSPQIHLAQQGGFFSKLHGWSFGSVSSLPSLDSLLAQPGNDPGQLAQIKSILGHFSELGSKKEGRQQVLEYGIAHLDLEGKIVWETLRYELQSILLPLSFTVK